MTGSTHGRCPRCELYSLTVTRKKMMCFVTATLFNKVLGFIACFTSLRGLECNISGVVTHSQGACTQENHTGEAGARQGLLDSV